MTACKVCPTLEHIFNNYDMTHIYRLWSTRSGEHLATTEFLTSFVPKLIMP